MNQPEGGADAARAEWHRRLIDSMDDGFCVVEVVVDDDDHVVDARYRDLNPAFSRLTGVPMAEGQLASVALPDLEKHWFERYEDVYKSGEPSFFVDRVDSLSRWYEVSLNRIGAKAERKLSCIFKDVSERQRREEEREQTSRRLHQLATALSESDRRKSEFLATLAHELRNPLAPIRSGLELIAEHRADPVAIDAAREILTRQVEQMVHLVDDLLDISRISQGTVALQLESARLSDVLGTAIEASLPLIESAGHTLDIASDTGALELIIDPVRITQVIANILNNAARYTPPGGHIRLETIIDDDSVRIDISDDGEGIDEDGLQQVFEMFTQIDGPETRQQGGLGIGLTLSRTLVELHDGTLRAFSEGKGRGSRFEITLPRRTRHPDPDAPEAAAPAPGPEDGTRRVLIVDDNRDAADTLAKLLGIRGFDTFVAYDGRSALVAVTDTTPDVVFLDIGLPDLTGYEVAAALSGTEQRERLTLVALTGWGAREDLKRSEEAGFDHHMTKPVSARKVLGLLGGIAQARASSDRD